jgi:hypothetical protein
MLIQEAVQIISLEPAPVIFLDTCSLLDVLRTAIRTRIENVPAARTFASLAAATPRTVWPILIQQVREEWNRNIPTVRNEVSRHIVKTDAAIGRIHDVLENLPPATRPNHIPLAGFNIEASLEQLSISLMNASASIEQDDVCFQKAMQRIMARLAPAERGGSVADCVILEHCLEIAAQLTANGFAHPLVLVTSNKDDYGTPGQMPPTLQAEFDMVNLQLSADLEHARAVCGL